ncbi:MAG TPA: hypothetical protein VG389_16125 [Myxococcota bacterium]|jgi:hypothetical protein|nr:hypothetical protein [Myxococcota bacterium]
MRKGDGGRRGGWAFLALAFAVGACGGGEEDTRPRRKGRSEGPAKDETPVAATADPVTAVGVSAETRTGGGAAGGEPAASLRAVVSDGKPTPWRDATPEVLFSDEMRRKCELLGNSEVQWYRDHAHLVTVEGGDAAGEEGGDDGAGARGSLVVLGLAAKLTADGTEAPVVAKKGPWGFSPAGAVDPDGEVSIPEWVRSLPVGRVPASAAAWKAARPSFLELRWTGHEAVPGYGSVSLLDLSEGPRLDSDDFERAPGDRDVDYLRRRVTLPGFAPFEISLQTEAYCMTLHALACPSGGGGCARMWDFTPDEGCSDTSLAFLRSPDARQLLMLPCRRRGTDLYAPGTTGPRADAVAAPRPLPATPGGGH